MNLLLHICCGPCSAACVKVLKDSNINITGYWYNPNIHPYNEYQKRLESLKEYSKMINLNVIYNDTYGLVEFVQNVVNNVNNRCGYCYYSRMENVVKYAKENGYDSFTSTLFISPYQKHDLLKNICENLSKKYDIKFKYIDFRPYYYIGKEMYHQTGLYMQKYCGCIFSEQESFILNDNNKFLNNIKFLPVKKSVIIKKVKTNKEQYIDFIIDENKEYLKDGDLFILKYKEQDACISLVTKVDEYTIEIKSIFTKEEYRFNGYGTKMIKYLYDNYKQKYSKLLVGTTKDKIVYFIKNGFDKYENKESANLIYYSKKLKSNKRKH